jgi:hypothetical protein
MGQNMNKRREFLKKSTVGITAGSVNGKSILALVADAFEIWRKVKTATAFSSYEPSGVSRLAANISLRGWYD